MSNRLPAPFLPAPQESFLRYGPRDAYDGAFPDEAAVISAWHKHRERILRDCPPGRRCWAWRVLDRPELPWKGCGFVESLARPGGNITGFSVFEYGISGKWLELLKEIAPRVTQVAVLRDLALASGSGQLGAIQSVAPSLGVELRPIGVGDAGAIERAVAAFARSANGGVIVTGSTLTTVHRELIVTLAARHRLPAVYPFRFFVAAGGLISYGPNSVDPYRRSAHYVDRILKGEKPADLPVQAPTKYELVINLKAAKVLGLTVPETLLARADEVIE